MTDLQPAPVNPLALVQQAIERGIDAEQLSKLIDLQERWERNQAAKGFALALAEFQASCPTVFKRRTAKVKDNFTYQFASYDDVMAAAGPVLAQCGLAVSFSTETVPPANAAIRVTCRVRHTIHTEETVVTVPVPQMTVNDTQRYGAAVSYAKRFAICAALNIVTTDEDDDAASQFQNVTEAQAAEIEQLLAQKNVNRELFLKFVRTMQPAEGVPDIAQANYPKIVDALRRKPAGGPK